MSGLGGWVAACLLLGLMLTNTARAQTVSGTLVSTAGAPIEGAVVQMTDTTGVLLAAAVTDREGRFRVSGKRRGQPFDVQFRHVAYLTLVARMERTREASIEAVMEPGPIVLPDLEIERDADDLSMVAVRSGFRERARKGWGEYVTPENQTWRASGVQGLARRVSFLVESFGPPSRDAPIRGSLLDAQLWARTLSGGLCSPTVYVDGVYMLNTSNAPFRIPNDVQGVEAYQSAISAPPPYNAVRSGDPQCAVVLFWTGPLPESDG